MYLTSGRGVTLTPHPFLVPLAMNEYSYTSIPPVGRTACTEPQCLYKGALYLYVMCLTENLANESGRGRDFKERHPLRT